jgi:hypothetical protein
MNARAVAAAAAACCALAACSSALGEGNSANGFGDDGGQTRDGAGADASPPEAGNGVHHARLVAVHASADLPDVRLCFQVNGQYSSDPRLDHPLPDDTNPPMPKSNYPGLQAGGAFRVPDLGALAGKSVTVTVIDANRISSGQWATAKCEELVCNSGGYCLSATKGDYFTMPELPSTTLAANQTYLLVLDGCAGTGGTQAQCGSDYAGTNNLKALAIETADGFTDVGGSAFPVQVAQLSHALDGLQVSAKADATQLALQLAFGQVAPALPASVAFPPTVDGWGQKTFDVQVTGGEAGATGPLVDSYASVQYATDPTQLPDQYFTTRANFVLAIVGDPSSAAQQPTLADGGANSAYDGHGLHLIVFPTNTP